MKSIMLLLVLLGFAGSASADLADLKRYSTAIKLSDQLRHYQDEQTTLIENNGALTAVITLATKGPSFSADIQNECAMLQTTDHLSACLETVGYANSRAAQMKLNAAKYALEQGNKQVAKQLYRDVIITFTGPAYASYVKQAEFGLEDLKQ